VGTSTPQVVGRVGRSLPITHGLGCLWLVSVDVLKGRHCRLCHVAIQYCYHSAFCALIITGTTDAQTGRTHPLCVVVAIRLLLPPFLFLQAISAQKLEQN